MQIETSAPIHPGQILSHELGLRQMSARQFSRHIGVSHQTTTKILNGDRAVSPIMAVRLSKAFANEPEYWMQLQMCYDLLTIDTTIAGEISQITPLPSEKTS